MEELIKDIEGIINNLGDSGLKATLICNKVRNYRVRNRYEYTNQECARILELTYRYVDRESIINSLSGSLSVFELERYYYNIDELNSEEIDILKRNIEIRTREMLKIINSFLYGNGRVNEDKMDFYLGEFFSLIDYKNKLNLPVSNFENELLNEFYRKYKEISR